MTKTLRFCIFLMPALFSVVFGNPESFWPTWRGPGMMGVSVDGNPPVTWSETENIRWKVKLTGDGSNSSPIVWGDRIIFQTAVETDKKSETAPETTEQTGDAAKNNPLNFYKFNVVCLDRKTGKTVWEKTVCEIVPHEGHHGDHGFASYSPITDGKLIWANFGSRGLYCLDMEGTIKWSKELGKLTIRSRFGEGDSPNLAGDNLIVVVDHEGDSFIAAFNKTTGQEVWKKSRDERTSWTSPIVAEVEGQTQVIVSGANRTRCYNPLTGDVIWECGGQTQNVIPTPVLGFGMVFCTSGFRGSMFQAIRLGKTGDLTGTDAVVWQITDATPYVPSPLLYGENLYFISGIKEIISCYNAKTGAPYYVKQTLDEMKGIYASPVGAADRVYFTGRNGITYVLKNSEKFEVLAINKLDDGIDCSAAIVGDELFLKGKQYLYCIGAAK